jgi:hypothetical protein
LPHAIRLGFREKDWTVFTDQIKRFWNLALGDMVASFVTSFTDPIGEKLGALAARATGMSSSIGEKIVAGAAGGTTVAAGAGGAGASAGAAAGAAAGAGVGYVAGAGIAAGGVLLALAGVEILGRVANALGFEGAIPLPSAMITNAIPEIRLMGKSVPNALVPDAAWIALNADAWAKTRDAYKFDTLDWKLSENRATRAVKMLNPNSRTGGIMRGVYLTTVTRGTGGGTVMPTPIGLDLLMNGGLTPEDLGVSERWIAVGNGTQVAYLTADGGVGFQAVDADTMAAAGASTTSAGGTTPSGSRTETTALTYPKVQSMAQTFAQGMGVLFGEQQRDVAGKGILDFMQQTTLSRGLASVQGQLYDAVQSMGMSLGSIPIPGSNQTFGDLFEFYKTKGSYATNNSNLITVNVDKFFGSDAELRQLTDEIIRIARQEGLTLSPIV